MEHGGAEGCGCGLGTCVEKVDVVLVGESDAAVQLEGFLCDGGVGV